MAFSGVVVCRQSNIEENVNGSYRKDIMVDWLCPKKFVFAF